MISDELEELASQLIEYWQSLYSSYPRYALDRSWPSVAVIDRVLQPLKGKPMLSEAEDQLLRHAAAYLACLLHDCWDSFAADVTVKAVVQQTPTFDIAVRARGGEFLPGEEECAVLLFSLLRRLLREPPNPFPIFENETRSLASDQNSISLLMRSLAAARSPYLKSPWQKTPQERFAPYFHGLVSFLAESASHHTLKTAPSADHAASPEIYHFNLLLPPLLYLEAFAASGASCGMVDYQRTFGLPNDELLTTAIVLAAELDEQIASAGFVVAAAVCSGEEVEKVIGLSQGFDSTVPLRPAMHFVRRMLKLPPDWFELLSEERYEEAEVLLRRERALGMLPLLILPAHYVREPRLHDFYYFASANESGGARSVLELYCAVHQAEPFIQLQLAYIDLLRRDFDSAEQIIKHVDSKAAAPSTRFFYYLLRARLSEFRGDIETAGGYYLRAATEECDDIRAWEELTAPLAAYLMSKGDFQRCLSLMEQIADSAPQLAAPRLAKAMVCIETNRLDEALSELNQLYRLAPANVRIFTLLHQCLVRRRFE